MWQRKLRSVLVGMALVVSIPSGVLATPMLSIHLNGGGSSLTVNSGASFTVEVRAQDIPTAGLFGFGYRVQHDATAFSTEAPTIDALWTGASAVSNTPGSPGATANLIGQASGPVGFDIVLAQGTFTAVRAGTFQLSLVPFTGVGDNVLFDGTDLETTVRAFFGTASVTVRRVVPEATLGALLGLGALAFAAARRSSRS